MRPKLQYMSMGAAVAELQTKLNKLLPAVLPPLKVDGKFGYKTLARVKAYQRSRGLVADGIVGAKTWAAIDRLAPPSPQAPATLSKPLNSPLQETLAQNFGVRFGSVLKCSMGSQQRMPPERRPSGSCRRTGRCWPRGRVPYRAVLRTCNRSKSAPVSDSEGTWRPLGSGWSTAWTRWKPRLAAKDPEAAKEGMENAEREVNALEKFLGH